MNDLNKGTNKVYENKVITTDEDYIIIRRCLLIWYLLLVVKMILFVALILIIYRMFLYTSLSFICHKLLGWGNLLGLGYWFLMVIDLGFMGVVLELQAEPEEIIDCYFFEHRLVHWLQLFPGKGMRLAHQEIHRYRCHKKREHKQKQQKDANNRSDK
ncbi:MAG: hypothetical protein IJM54_02695 [Thermoguttaceae bacterium]|nr:hypothetical protein [Thermoguttaceae bacterium]